MSLPPTPWPGTVYPSDTYPSGYSGGQRIHAVSGETPWTNTMGRGSAAFYVDGVQTFSRTVEHRIIIHRGRTGHTGELETQTVSGRFVGVADPAIRAGEVFTVKLDPYAVSRVSGVSIPVSLCTRTDRARLTRANSDPRKHQTITSFQATGNLSRLGRVVVASNPFPQELVHQRFVRIMQTVQTAGATDIVFGRVDTTTNYLKELDVDTRSALEVLNELAEDAGGHILEDRLGRIGWWGVAPPASARVVKATLDASILIPQGEWEHTTEGMLNQLVMTRTRKWKTYTQAKDDAGNPYTEVEDHEKEERIGTSADPEMIRTHGLYSATKDAGTLRDDADIIAIGRQIQKQSGRPLWSPPAMKIDLLHLVRAKNQTTLNEVLGLEPGHLVHLTGLPRWLPLNGASQMDLWVEGITETIAHDEWSVMVDLSREERHMIYP